jgi:ketosteroid isomerase-like protein
LGSVRFEPEFIEAGDRVVTPITTYSRGRDGIELPARFVWLWSFRNGQVQRITFFQDGGEALEAAGLAE